MIDAKLQFSDLEVVVDYIAEGVDKAPADKRELFLAKLALALVNYVEDKSVIQTCINASLKDL